ncbi:hypothetical protein [Sporosarcina ureae]|uniref:hypothetical protein n=1 Tax=Sporosarcina ureae TaxID=1571 RepID=UPI000A17C0BA|nr:hypothetical protein [Sporosarcina ureae]ARK22268.1 hypothetical protein SporoP32a_12465 [Sporosarcina ureae]
MNEGMLSRELEWFVRTLASEFGVFVSTREVAVEAVELGVEEVDECYLPLEVVKNLPETFLYELMIVDDAGSNEWLGAVAFHPNSPEWCLQLVQKNGELLYRKPLRLTL